MEKGTFWGKSGEGAKGGSFGGKKENVQLRALSAVGILLVVAGHADFPVFDLGGLFPYYSFHVALFVFISGYFYEEEAQKAVGGYCKRKLWRLLLPYYIWNVFYGLFAGALRRGGFAVGQGIGWKTLLLEPFLGGHQFGWNFPAWFVPALFSVEMINLGMRKALEWLHLKKEWIILSVCLMMGIGTVWLAKGGHVWGYYKFPGRLLFMLPCFQMGHFYKSRLEKWDILPNGVYFAGVFALQLAIVFTNGGLAYSTVWCTGFANGPLTPYLTIVTGIALWLRVARILAPLLERLPFVEWVGRNTYGVMMHHILGFLAVKGILYGISVLTPWCGDFDKAAFLADVNYVYVPGGVETFRWVYVFAGIGAAFLIQWCERRMLGRRGGADASSFRG